MNNFLGYQALVLGKACRDRALLSRQLDRLGIDVRTTWPASDTECRATHMIFLDADSVRQAPQLDHIVAAVNGPVITLLGSDTPSVVDWSIGLGAAGCLMKPIRNAGILATLIMAFHTFEARREAAAQLADLRHRLKARPLMCTAVIRLMRELAVHEDAAFQLMRTASMERRMAIEDLAGMLVSGELSISAIASTEGTTRRRADKLQAGGKR